MLARSRDKQKRPEGEAGYTLIELLVVLAVLALLAVAITPQFIGRFSKAKVDAARIQIDSLVSTVDTFYLDMGRYPTQEEGLDILWRAAGEGRSWNGPYVRKPKNLVDPWGRTFLYRRPGTNQMQFDIYTLGADGLEGGSGEDEDVGSWPQEG